MIANPQDVDAKIRFWRIAEQLDSIRKQREIFGEQQSILVGKLLEGTNGAQNFEGAEAAFSRKLGGFIQENPKLSRYLVAGGMEAIDVLQKRMERFAELQQRFKELQERSAALNEKYSALKEEDRILAEQAKDLSKTGKEGRVEELRENTDQRKEVAGKMKSVKSEYDELSEKFKELTAEFNALP